MITSKRTFVQSFSSFSVFIFNRDFNRFITCLQCKPFCGNLLLVDGTYQDTAFRVFGSRASMKSDAAASGHITDKRQHTFEARRECDRDRIGSFWYDIVRIFERCDVSSIHAHTSAYSLALSANSRQVDGCHAYSSICKCNQCRTMHRRT